MNVKTNTDYAFFQGDFVPLKDARVSIMNHAFLYGTAVFEGIRAYWNDKDEQLYIFRMKEHLERMFDSMKIMYLDSKYSIDELSAIVVELLRRNAPRTDVYIRPAAYKAAERIGPSLLDNPTELAIFTVPFGDYFKGAGALRVIISNWRRVEDNAIPARGKVVGCYANTALAKSEAISLGFDDCIVLSENGHVSEGSAMNLFMVKHGQLITPSSTENILEGVTRASIMEYAEADFKIKTACRPIDRSELYTADELFFSGTGAQIAPIVEVDKRPVGTGTVGPLTKKILDRYVSISHGAVPAYSKWLIPVYENRPN